DAASFTDASGHTLPGLSPVAMQQGRAVAESIFASEDGRSRKPFRYRDKGTMATIGRSRAVAQTGSFRMSGLLAWLAWLVVHVWYLIGFRSRLVVLLTWAWSYVTYKRGARLITASSAPAEPRGPRLIVATNTASDTKTESGT
ncbi:MAG: NAD(P)/FAD-dependent oxidoreductase, partial [Polyangiaceae bacterium]